MHQKRNSFYHPLTKYQSTHESMWDTEFGCSKISSSLFSRTMADRLWTCYSWTIGLSHLLKSVVWMKGRALVNSWHFPKKCVWWVFVNSGQP